MQVTVLVALFGVVVLVSILAAPRRASVEGFFSGRSATGVPGVWMLVLSQVTTWIFARSLMNAAILGYYYGIAGTLAYAAYYGSFLTGGFIVARLRQNGSRSVQDWLNVRFGAAGTTCYNLIIALRLLSEVFANLLVVGLIAGALVEGASTIAIVVVAVIGFTYAAWGGLTAALRTDVVQMLLFLVVFLIAFLFLVTMPGFSLAAVLTAPGASGAWNGWVLLAVAFLQVFSYPAHDPVMMDRGFISDAQTTKKSFLHAFWISTLCIVAFGFFGIQASLEGALYETQLIGTWNAMFPSWVFVLLVLSLLISAISTLDSALSSAARLGVEELQLAPRSLIGGRLIMLGFLICGAVMTVWGNATLFDAVAVSGTASMFLTPVLIVGLVMQKQISVWGYLGAFVASVWGALVYFGRDWAVFAAVLPEGHKYEQLFVICGVVLVSGFVAVLAGSRRA